MHNTISSLSRNDYYGTKYLQRLRNEIKRAEKKITSHQPPTSDTAVSAGTDDATVFGGNALFQRSLLTSDIRASISDMTLFPSIPNKEKAVAKQQQPLPPPQQQPPVLTMQRQKSTVAHREPPQAAVRGAAATIQPFALRSDEIELPLLSVTKKPVNAYTRETNPRSPLPERRLEYAVNLERAQTKLSPAMLKSARARSRAHDSQRQPQLRSEQLPQQQQQLLQHQLLREQRRQQRRQQPPQLAQHYPQAARTHHQLTSPAQTPQQQLHRGSPRDRLVISPSLSLYSDRSAGSAASIEDLAFLTVRGERLTPVSVASLSPAQSPSRTPNDAAAASPLGDGGAAAAAASRDASRQSQLPSPASLAVTTAAARRSQAAAAAAASRGAFLPPGQRLLRSPRTVSRRGRARAPVAEWSAAAFVDAASADSRELRAGYHRAPPPASTVYSAGESAAPGVLHYVDFGGTAEQQRPAFPAYARPSPPKAAAGAAQETRRASRKREARTPVARASAAAAAAAAAELTGTNGSLYRQRTVVTEAGTQTDVDGDASLHGSGETLAEARMRRHAAASAAAAALYAGGSSGGGGVASADGTLLYMLQQSQQFSFGGGGGSKVKRAAASLSRDSASISYVRPTAASTGSAAPQPPVDGKTASMAAREGAQPRLPSIQLVDVKTRKKSKKATIVVKSVVNETNTNGGSAGSGGRRADGDGVVQYSRESTIHIDIAIHNADDDFEPSLDLATEALLLALPVQKSKASSGRIRSASSELGPSPPPPQPAAPVAPTYIPEIRMTSATPPADSGSDV